MCQGKRGAKTSIPQRSGVSAGPGATMDGAAVGIGVRRPLRLGRRNLLRGRRRWTLGGARILSAPSLLLDIFLAMRRCGRGFGRGRRQARRHMLEERCERMIAVGGGGIDLGQTMTRPSTQDLVDGEQQCLNGSLLLKTGRPQVSGQIDLLQVAPPAQEIVDMVVFLV